MILHWLIDWLPPYTEQWATTYLQVLFEGFLFALGVPTAIYSLIIDNDIKRVAQTRVKARRYFVVTALLYVSVFIIVWFLHPEPNSLQSNVLTGQPGAELRAPPAKQIPGQSPEVASATPQAQVTAVQPPVQASTRLDAPDEAPAQPDAPTQTVAQQTPQPLATQGGTPQQTAGQRTDTPKWSSVIKSIIAAATVTILPFVVLLTGLRLNGQFKREKVVARLADELLERLDADRSIDTTALKDLSYLGEHGKAGEEKDIVLDVINRLAENVQDKVKAHELKYNGYELESLIRHIPAMLDNTIQPGNSENYRHAVEVLANIWRWLGTRRISDDALSTREALTHLAVRSVERTDEDTSLAYLEIAADCDSHMVFDMGLLAIKIKKYPLAAAVLSKLEAMADDANPDNRSPNVHRETKANLLGMAACLAADGPSGARRTETGLHFNQELFSPSLRDALADAFDYHYYAGRFDISDTIQLLVSEASKMKTVDLDRHIPVTTSKPDKIV
jgi:hypothetical protein